MSMNVTVTTFEELDEWVDAFIKPNGLRLVFLVGNPGNSKSHKIRTRLNPEMHRLIKCARLTALQLYKQLFRHKDKAIVLDDVEDALRRHDTGRILMNVCETDEESRRLAWFGSESLLKDFKGRTCIGIPQEFTTSSRICLVSNDWDILKSKFQALLDRAVVVFFDPAPEEIHHFAGQWFQDKEIYDFVGEHLAEISQHSLRYYVLAKDVKQHGLDWQKALLESWTHESEEIEPEKVVELILADPRYTSDKERIEAFTAMTGRQRRQWYNLKKKVGKKRINPTKGPAPSADLAQYQPEEIPQA